MRAPELPISAGVPYSSMEIGRGLMPRLDSRDRYAETCAAMSLLPFSSCQAITSGTVPLALASVRNELIQDWFHAE